MGDNEDMGLLSGQAVRATASTREEAEQRWGSIVASRYRVEDLQAFDEMGALYRARDTERGVPCVLRVLPEIYARDPEVMARFIRDAQAAQELKHPNIAQMFDIGKLDDGSVYAVTELLDGQNLATVIQEEGRISAGRAVHVASQVSRALGTAHESGIIHRDLKPSNIVLVDQEGGLDFVKIVDFGICSHVDYEPATTSSQQELIVGSSDYMAPEQAAGAEADPASDIYALGSVLFEMLTGRLPYKGRNAIDVLIQKGARDAPRVADIAPDVPDGLSEVIAACLSRLPEDRPKSMRVLEVELLRGLDSKARPVKSAVAAALAGAGLGPTDDDDDGLGDLPIPPWPESAPSVMRVRLAEASSDSVGIQAGGRSVVHIGASAPSAAKPGDEFTARLAAYHPTHTAAANAALKQPGATTHAKLDERTGWAIGATVRVQLSGNHVRIHPGERVFVWDGQMQVVDFDVQVDRDSEPCRIQLRFELFIENLPVARACLPLIIRARASWLYLLLPATQSLVVQAYQSAYASYDRADLPEVSKRIAAIQQFTGVQFFSECLSLDPREQRKVVLADFIAKTDVFTLFWSPRAAQSTDVEWEWRTAVERRDAASKPVAAQRLHEGPVPVLPVEFAGLVSDPKAKPGKLMTPLDRKFFTVGCVLFVLVAVMIVWAFAIGDMTPDQRTIMRILLSLVSGFVVGSFVGAFTVKASGLVPGSVATATGGFGVWFLSAFILLPAAVPFGAVVQPHGPLGPLDTLPSGTVSLQIGVSLAREEIDRKGQAHFSSIPSEYEGSEVAVRVESPDFTMSDPAQKVKLQKGDPLLVPMTQR